MRLEYGDLPHIPASTPDLVVRDHMREFSGLPPSFAALESQISDDRRSRSDSLSSVSGSNVTRCPLPTPSISPATSTPHHGVVGFSLGGD